MKYFLLFPVRLLTAVVYIVGCILWLVGAIMGALPHWLLEGHPDWTFEWVARESDLLDEQMSL